MRFAHPEYAFLLLIPLFLLLFLSIVERRNRRALELLAGEETIPKIVDLSGRRLRRRQMGLRIIALIFLVFSLLGPQWGYEWREVKTEGREIIFALDTSKSMLAMDLKPNRLDRAKLAIKDLVLMAHGDRVGLVAFAGGAFLQCPLTLDYNAFGIALDSLDTRSIPRGGTAIGEAIVTAERAFETSSADHKILILITDGENHESDPLAAAKKARKDGIVIYTIGLGSPEGELILIEDEQGNSSYLRDLNGQVVKSALNERILREIAEAGDGLYLRGQGLSLRLDHLYREELSRFKGTELRSSLQKSYLNRYQLPLLLALLLFVIELLLGYKIKPQEK